MNFNDDSEGDNDDEDDDDGPVGWKTSSNFSTRIQDDEDTEPVPYQDNFTDDEEPDDEQEQEPQYEDGYTSASSNEQESQLKKTIKRSRVTLKAATVVVILQEENDFK